MRKIELLSPAGDMERLEYAINYGADAVYLALDKFGMRTASKNFNAVQLKQAVEYAHSRDKKVYLAMNTVPTNDEIAVLPNSIHEAKTAQVDAFIVADLGVLSLVKTIAPDIDVHFSTQVGIANYMSAATAYNMGAKRVVLARELSLPEIAFIRQNTPPELELEAFVHGAMCMSFSGRCLISHYMTGRNANKGECAQPCRWKYKLTSDGDNPKVCEIGEEEGGSYIMNADDLCTAPFIGEIIRAGIDSLKIEGRAKSFYYVASITSAYRRAVDEYLQNGENSVCPNEVLEELTRTSHRHYSPGFFFGPKGAVQNGAQGGYIREWDVVAVVENYNDGILTCTQRGKFSVGDELEILTPSGEVYTFTPSVLINSDGEEIESTPHALMEFKTPCPYDLPRYSILRKKV